MGKKKQRGNGMGPVYPRRIFAHLAIQGSSQYLGGVHKDAA